MRRMILVVGLALALAGCATLKRVYVAAYDAVFEEAEQ
jgi:hypothetical protein